MATMAESAATEGRTPVITESAEQLDLSGDSSITDEINRWSVDSDGGFVPHCPTNIKPTIGMTFGSLDSGIKHYKNYGRYCGFMTRLGTQKSSKTSITLKYITCSREGERVTRSDDADEEFRQYRKRRCITTRTSCRAMISLKLSATGEYVIVKFVEPHNHPFYSPEHFQELRGNRKLNDTQRQFVMDCQKANVSATSAFNVCSAIVGGAEHVGATAVDFRNCQTELKVYLSEADVQVVINEFISDQESDPDLYYEYDHDENDRLTQIFWADGLCRSNYEKWGDSISFDSTYGTNRYSMVFCPITGVDNHDRCVTFGAALISKEDILSFIWVFQCFMRAMKNKEPLCIITDQDAAIKNAIGQVFTTTKHRFCMWHIMRKLPEKVRKTVPLASPFHSRLNTIVWTDRLTPTTFEEKWNSIIQQFGLSNNDALTTLYDIRESWIPAYFKDFPMAMLLRTTSRSESQNSTFGFNASKLLTLKEFMWRFNGVVNAQRRTHCKLVYQYSAGARPAMKTMSALELDAWNVFTRPLFNKVRMDIMEGIFSCGVTDINREGNIATYTVKSTTFGDVTVDMNEESGHCNCKCKRLEGKGLICVHIFSVLNSAQICRIPRSMVHERWCREAPGASRPSFLYAEEDADRKVKNLLHIEIWSTVQSLISNSNTTDDLESLLAVLNKHRAAHDCNVRHSPTPKRKTIEQLTGIVKPPRVNVYIPAVCKNKGSGRRLQSDREKSINKQQAKAFRKCGYCKVADGHTSRHCEKKKMDEAAKD